jgi:hypothetical protein
MKDKGGLPAPLQPGRQLVTVPRPDPAKRAALLERIKARDLVRETANPRPIPPALPYTSPPARADLPVVPVRTREASPPRMAVSTPEQVLLHMTCGASGGQYIGLAERRGDTVLLVGCEPLPPGRGNEAIGLLAGSYRLEWSESWVCPFCHSQPARLWSCNCARFGGALHTDCGSGVMQYCQCGKFEPRYFHDVEKMQARGASVASASPVTGRSIVRR